MFAFSAKSPATKWIAQHMAQLWGKKQQQKTLLKSSVVNGVSLFSSLAVFPKKSEKQKIVERRKKASCAFSFFLYFSFYISKCQPDSRGQETFWEKQCIAEPLHTHTHTVFLSYITLSLFTRRNVSIKNSCSCVCVRFRHHEMEWFDTDVSLQK